MPGPGTLLAGRYRLHDLVGTGGMGEVWRATDQVLGRTVAVKVLRPELLAQPGFAERFRTEARTLATIRHPGVVTVHDYHSDGTGALLVMAYIDGESLASVLRREHRLDPAAAMVLVAEAAEALQAAHDHGVVHRDIKPANLLVDGDGSVVLTDFGIARAADATSLTLPGTVVGTPAYLAPEQLLGHPATARSDLYSLGVVGYECLMGRRPFDVKDAYDLTMWRVQEAPPPMAGDVPAAVAAVIERALAGEPSSRWRSAADMAAGARQAADLTGDSLTTLRKFLPGRAAPPRPPSDTAPPPPAPASPPPVAPAVPLRPTRVESQPWWPAVPERAGPVPASQAPPAAASPSAPVVPWTGPPRPAIVTVAGALFLVTAMSMLLVTVVTLSVLEPPLGAVEEVAGQSWAGVVAVAVLVGLAMLGLAGVGYLLVAATTIKGRPAARGWAFALAVPLLCCCLPGWCSAGAADGVEGGQAQVLADRVAAALPSWYAPMTGMWMAAGGLALLVALLLVVLPAAGRYFRAPRVIVYYPYQAPPSAGR